MEITRQNLIFNPDLKYAFSDQLEYEQRRRVRDILETLTRKPETGQDSMGFVALSQDMVWNLVISGQSTLPEKNKSLVETYFFPGKYFLERNKQNKEPQKYIQESREWAKLLACASELGKRLRINIDGENGTLLFAMFPPPTVRSLIKGKVGKIGLGKIGSQLGLNKGALGQVFRQMYENYMDYNTSMHALPPLAELTNLEDYKILGIADDIKRNTGGFLAALSKYKVRKYGLDGKDLDFSNLVLNIPIDLSDITAMEALGRNERKWVEALKKIKI